MPKLFDWFLPLRARMYSWAVSIIGYILSNSDYLRILLTALNLIFRRQRIMTHRLLRHLRTLDRLHQVMAVMLTSIVDLGP